MADCTTWLNTVIAQMRAAPNQSARTEIAEQAIESLTPQNCSNLGKRTELIWKIEAAVNGN